MKSSTAPPVEATPAIIDNLVVVQTRINDSSPPSFVLDTGASTSVIDLGAARTLGLKLGERDTATTGGGAVDSVSIEGVQASIGEVRLPDLPLAAIDLSGRHASLGHPIDGTLGYDVFARHVVRLMTSRRPCAFTILASGCHQPTPTR